MDVNMNCFLTYPKTFLKVALFALLIFGLQRSATATQSADDPPPPPPDVGARTAPAHTILPRGHKHLKPSTAGHTVALPVSRPQGQVTEVKTLKQKQQELHKKGAK
jgi:hypothetical protein